MMTTHTFIAQPQMFWISTGTGTGFYAAELLNSPISTVCPKCQYKFGIGEGWEFAYCYNCGEKIKLKKKDRRVSDKQHTAHKKCPHIITHPIDPNREAHPPYYRHPTIYTKKHICDYCEAILEPIFDEKENIVGFTVVPKKAAEDTRKDFKIQIDKIMEDKIWKTEW